MITNHHNKYLFEVTNFMALPFKLRCRICGHEWIRKSDSLPMRCPNPKCQSPYWDRPKEKRCS